MRVIIAIAALGGLAFLALIGLWLWDRVDARRRGPTDVELDMLVKAMARHLDRALADPMVRQTTDWEKQAEVLVNRYYGKGLR
jgi:hypothetical protein